MLSLSSTSKTKNLQKIPNLTLKKLSQLMRKFTRKLIHHKGQKQQLEVQDQDTLVV